MRPSKIASSAKKSKNYPPGSFIGKLRKRRIIETLAAFIGGGWLILEFVHWILIDHYHFPEKSLDITIATLICALLCTLIWRWFRDIKKARKVKPEILLIPLIILATILIDTYFLLHLREVRTEIVTGEIVESQWQNSVAVLPFTDISPKKDQEYFCDGLTDELINALSNIKELKVVARTSVFSFKGKEIDIREIGDKLNVDNVLEGSVRKADSQLRITAQLINVADGYHLWSEKYDRKLKDVFAIQDEISLAIVNKLKINLLGGENAKLVKRYTENIEAHNLYLKGRYFWNKREKKDLEKSIEYFKEAIEKDPTYALAYSGLADSYNMLGEYYALSPNEAYPRAIAAALKALEIDSALSEARNSLAWSKMAYDWDWKGAEVEFKRAIDFNPGYANAHHWYAIYLVWMGRPEEALKEIKLALELDPISLVINRNVGVIFYYSHQYDQAIKALQKTSEMDPNFSEVSLFLGCAYLEKSMFVQALEEYQKDKKLSKGGSVDRAETYIGVTYARMGKRSEAKKILESLQNQSRERYVSPWFLACLNFALGENNQGFKYLEKAYKDRDSDLIVIRSTPILDSVRSDPRFKTLLKKMSLDE